MLIYIWGNLTADNFTPRPGKDTIGRPGQKAGLSASDAIAPGRKAQGIDTDKLKPPLQAIPDDTNQGGRSGHFAIAPVDENGDVAFQTIGVVGYVTRNGANASVHADIARCRRRAKRERKAAMTMGAVAYFQPVARTKYLDRLAAFSPDPIAAELWTEVHQEIQRQFTILETEVRRKMPGLRVDAGRTQGERFLLFSYRTFSVPDAAIDPVVAGITFTPNQSGVTVEADVSGEQTGDLISSMPSQTVAYSREDLLAAARGPAQKLCQTAEAIVAALQNPSRRVE